MYQIVLYTNKKRITKDFKDLTNLESFTKNLFESNIVLDWNKCWILKDKQLFAVIDCILKEIRYVSDMVFTNPDSINSFKAFSETEKGSNSEYYKFACKAWGTTTYLGYNDLPKSLSNDILKFNVKFPPEQIKKERRLIEYNYSDFQEEEGEEIDEDAAEDQQDWIQEGMSIGGNKYLTQNVFDNLLGLGMQVLKNPIVCYRVWGLLSGKTDKDKNYQGWVSCCLRDNYSGDNEIAEKFILPARFPICNTMINGEPYADYMEIIVRNEDLVQL